jgi:hypothetical protein
MPKLSTSSVPSYRLHRQSDQAIVTLSGRDYLLGPHKTVASRTEYDRRITEWIAAGRQRPVEQHGVTVAEVVAAFRRHAKGYYGDASRALVNIDEALRPVLKLYGRTVAAAFGPLKLKAVRQAMIDSGRVRGNVNRLISHVKHVFGWAVENEMLSGEVFHALQAVGGLRAGRSGAVEGEPVKPVPIAHVEAVIIAGLECAA